MRLKGKVIKCSAANCPSKKQKNEDSDVVCFFSFPTEDKASCKEWVTKTQNPDLVKMSTIKLKSNHLCSRHFDDSQFSNDEKTVLKEHAIPTIFDNSSSLITPRSHSQRQMASSKFKNEAIDLNNIDDDGDQKLFGGPPSLDDGLNDGLNAGDSQTRLDDGVDEDDGGTGMKTYLAGNTHCQWCSAINCSNNRIRQPNLSFFRLPTDHERGKKWIINSQRFDLLKKSYSSLHNMFCAEHFEPDCIISKNNASRRRLFRWAVPTIFNFSVKKKLRSGKKPTPTYPASSIHSGRGSGHGNNSQTKRNRLRPRNLKRKHQATDESEEPEQCGNKRQATVKELKTENLDLSERISQLMTSRVEMMRRLEELEGIMAGVQEHSSVNVPLLGQALDTSKHPSARREFDRLSSAIRLLSDLEEVGEPNGTEDICFDSLD